jgi:ribosomal protein S18 acetylase RimI-like enzyme
MEDSNFKFRILSLDRFNYPMLKSRLIDLYLTAFTQGEYAQYIDKADAEETVEFLIENGFGDIAIYNEEIVAFTLATTLSFDKEFPIGVLDNVKHDNIVYIAEVIVNSDFRRNGLATALIDRLIGLEKYKYSGAVIRVWEKNRPALSLYQKLGFSRVAEISQTKMSSPTEEFQMRKIYLYKNFNV